MSVCALRAVILSLSKGAKESGEETTNQITKLKSNTKISAQSLKSEFESYLDKCRENTIEVSDKTGKVNTIRQPKIPTIKDFWCVHLGKAWADWQTALEQKTTAKTCQTIRDRLEGIVLDALINGEGNSTGLIFDLKANYGYTDKQLTGDGLEIKKIEISVRRDNQP